MMNEIDRYAIIALGMCALICLTAIFLQDVTIIGGMVAVPFTLLIISNHSKTKDNDKQHK